MVGKTDQTQFVCKSLELDPWNESRKKNKHNFHKI